MSRGEAVFQKKAASLPVLCPSRPEFLCIMLFIVIKSPTFLSLESYQLSPSSHFSLIKSPVQIIEQDKPLDIYLRLSFHFSDILS